MQPNTFTAEGVPGTWTATVELEDAAGNRQRFEITTDFSAPEATIGEELKTPGSMHNLALIGLLLVGIALIQAYRKRKLPNHDNSNFEHPELDKMDSMFEDDYVV